MTTNATSARLRDAVLEELCRAFEDGVVVTDDEGNAEKLSPSPQYVNAAVSFLKLFPPMDLPTANEQSEVLKGYSEKMPFPRPVK